MLGVAKEVCLVRGDETDTKRLGELMGEEVWRRFAFLRGATVTSGSQLGLPGWNRFPVR